MTAINNILNTAFQKVINFSSLNYTSESKNNNVHNLIKNIALKNSNLDTILNLICEKNSDIEETRRKLIKQEQDLLLREEKINRLFEKEKELEQLKVRHTILNGKYKSVLNKINQEGQTDYESKNKIKLLLFGDFKCDKKQIKSIIKSKINTVNTKLEIDIINKYDVKKSNIIEKLKKGNYSYCIYGPTPHSIKGKDAKMSIKSWAENNKISTKFIGSNDRSISKSKLEHLVRTLSN